MKEVAQCLTASSIIGLATALLLWTAQGPLRIDPLLLLTLWLGFVGRSGAGNAAGPGTRTYLGRSSPAGPHVV